MLSINAPPTVQSGQDVTPLSNENIYTLAQRIIQMTQAYGNVQLTNGNGTNFWDQFITTTVLVASGVCMYINVYIHIEVLNSNMINLSFSHINSEYICISQLPGDQGQCDWLQFSVWLGGQQCGSNYNTRIQYIFIERSVDRSARPKHDASALHPLHPDAYNAKLDRKIYNRWFQYDRELYCSPGMMINPDIGIVTGCVSTFYGEIESSGSKEKSMLGKLDQVSARMLCYTDKCFSMFAQLDKIHLKFY